MLLWKNFLHLLIDKVIISIEYIVGLSAQSTNHSLLDGGDYNRVHFK